jgi:carboxymethylenebutenolidase
MVGRVLFLLAVIAGALGCWQAPAVKMKTEVESRQVVLSTNDGDGQGVEYVPPGPPAGFVLVLHGDYGLDDSIRASARRLAEKRYYTLAPDLYGGKVAKDVEEAHILSRALPDEEVKARLKAAMDHLEGLSGEKKPSLGVIGWDLGAGYALDLAMADERVSACVVCYGRLTTDPEALGKMRASVLGIFGGKDAGITPEIRRDFREAMKQAKRDMVGMHVFDECDGGFMNPGPDRQSGAADAAASARAWEHIDAFLRERLR